MNFDLLCSSNVNALFHADPRETDMAFVFEVTKIDDAEVSISTQELAKQFSTTVLMYSLHIT